MGESSNGTMTVDMTDFNNQNDAYIQNGYPTDDIMQIMFLLITVSSFNFIPNYLKPIHLTFFTYFSSYV